MGQDLSALVRGKNIRDLLFAGTVDACKQMQDVWPVLGEEERDRMTNLIDAWAIKTEAEIARRLGSLFGEFLASGQPNVQASEKGIGIEGSTVTIKLAAVRANVPREFFTHKGQFLIVLTDGDVLSLEELNRQGDFFADDDTGPSPAAELADQLRGESPIVAQFKASQEAAGGVELEAPAAPAVEEPLIDMFRDEFLITLGQLTSAEHAARYDVGGEFAGLLELYLGAGWTPASAAVNESIDPAEQRLITDGPPGVSDPDEEGGNADV